jgi:hypothetical protein
MGKTLPEYYILRDNREKNQKGWWFDEEEKVAGKTRILGTKECTLNAADYTIEGAEDLIRIERKYGFTELFGNMTPKESELRFVREMEKLRDIPHKYILIESNLSSDILQLSVQQFRGVGPPCHRIAKWLIDLEMEYNIHIWFVGDCGKRIAKSIFDSIARKYL